MNTERWKQIDELLDAVLDVPEHEREQVLSEMCGGDDKLKERVLTLLRATPGDFLQHSAMGIAVRNLAGEHAARVDRTFIGRTIGTYTVEEKIGVGGMGEVYLATDSKFDRRVALKILLAEYSYDDERLKRFALEARAVSSLNHPNIVTIYDVGTIDGINYLATEYVEGKTLRALIDQLDVTAVLRVCIQACEALAAAHSAGVIHRDIKPENIMVRPDGYAKVLDFGLAKLSDKSHRAKVGLAKTGHGMIVGTPAYMSPEQITDEQIDHRTDLWSLGVVMFELLTGSNPFKRESRRTTFEAILSAKPRTVAPTAHIPRELAEVVARALNKDRDLRYQTASEFAADLQSISSGVSSGSVNSPSVGTADPRRRFRRFAYLATLLSVAVCTGMGVWYFFISDGRAGLSADWAKATNVQLTDQGETEYFPSLAPDGKSFVFAADHRGNFDIYSQRVGGKIPVNLTADSAEDDTQPAFSRDGEQIAFRSERGPKGIYLMGATGENLRRVSDLGFHPSFSPDGKEIAVSGSGYDQPTVRMSGPNGIWIVNLETGLKRELSSLAASFPAWSPDGKHVAFWFYPEVSGRRDIAVISADGGREIVLTKDFGTSNWNPVWSPDGSMLYFVSDRNGNLNVWRVGIDKATGTALGQPEPINAPSKYSRHPSFSSDGKRMVYVQTNNQANIRAARFDAKNTKTVGEPYWLTNGDREVARAELSPDGKQFLMRQIKRTQDDIVTYNLETCDWQDVTSDAPFDRYPRWSPDGKQIAFVSDRSGNYEIWVSRADGSSLRQLTFVGKSESGTSFPNWSPDGQRLIYSVDGRGYMIDMTKGWTEQIPEALPRPTDGSNFVVWDWSPDGMKLAGTFSDGNREVGIYSFVTRKFTRLAAISDASAHGIPSWLPNSRDIVYVDEKMIYLADTETKEIRELLKIDSGQARSPFVSRDGTLLYYVAHTNESDIWLLDNSASE